MLEHEVVQREELEVECQRLKDEVRGGSITPVSRISSWCRRK